MVNHHGSRVVGDYVGHLAAGHDRSFGLVGAFGRDLADGRHVRIGFRRRAAHEVGDILGVARRNLCGTLVESGIAGDRAGGTGYELLVGPGSTLRRVDRYFHTVLREGLRAVPRRRRSGRRHVLDRNGHGLEIGDLVGSDLHGRYRGRADLLDHNPRGTLRTRHLIELVVGGHAGLAGLQCHLHLVARLEREAFIGRVRVDAAAVERDAVLGRRGALGHQLQVVRRGVATLLVGHDNRLEIVVLRLVDHLLLAAGSLAQGDQLGNRRLDGISGLRIGLLAAVERHLLTAVAGLEQHVIEAVCTAQRRREADIERRDAVGQREVGRGEVPATIRIDTLGEGVGQRRRPVRTVVAQLDLELVVVERVVAGAVEVALRTEREGEVLLRNGDLLDRYHTVRAEEQVVVARTGIVRIAGIRRRVAAHADARRRVGHVGGAAAGLVLPAVELVGIRPLAIGLRSDLLVHVVEIDGIRGVHTRIIGLHVVEGDGLAARTLEQRHVVETVCAAQRRTEADIERRGTLGQREVGRSEVPAAVRINTHGEGVGQRGRPVRTVVAQLHLELVVVERVVVLAVGVALRTEREAQVDAVHGDLLDREVRVRAEEQVVHARAGIIRIVVVRVGVVAHADARRRVGHVGNAVAALVLPALELVGIGPRVVSAIGLRGSLLVEVVGIGDLTRGDFAAGDLRYGDRLLGRTPVAELGMDQRKGDLALTQVRTCGQLLYRHGDRAVAPAVHRLHRRPFQ